LVLGILNQQGSDFLSRTVIAAGDGTVYLRLPEPRESGDLTIQSWEQGVPADVRIDAITVLEPWSTVEELVGKAPVVSSSDAPD
jgi:hypothetical protein